MVQPFQYDRHLVSGDEIRVLCLFPGDAGVPLKATIEYCKLGTKLDYQALSYTWESPLNRDNPSRGYQEPRRVHDLWINDFLLKITPNLDSALRHLRHPQNALTFWIDAVCIDQEHNEEKSWQIQQMRNIYEQASRVIVWLGPSADSSTLAMDTLQSMSRFKNRSDPYTIRGTTWCDVPAPKTMQEYYDQLTSASLGRLFGKPIESDIAIPPYPIEAIADMLNRAYWGRGWCWQEFAVAKNVTIACGNRTLEDGDTCLQVFTQTWDLLKDELGRQPWALDHRPWAMIELRRAYRNIADLRGWGFEDDPTITPPFSRFPLKIWVYENVRKNVPRQALSC